MGVLDRHEPAVIAYERALEFLDVSNAAHPVAQCLKNLGSSLERHGAGDLAVARYRQALQLMPNLVEAHAALGSHHHRRGEFDDALAHFDRALFAEGTPAFDSVAGWRINVLFNLKDGKAAFRDVNALTGKAMPAGWVWPWCANQVAAFGRASVENALQATNFWEKFLGAHPDNPDGVREGLLCRLYLRQEGQVIGEYPAVKAEVERCIGLFEPEVSALLWDRLGHWAQDESDWIEAEACFRLAFDMAGGHYGYCLGTALNFLGRYRESLPLLREQAESIQPDAMSWHQLAIAHDSLGQLSEAIVAFRRAVDLDPDHDVAWFNLGGAHWNNGEVAQAMLVWKEALERHPEHSLAQELRGRFPGVLA